MKKWVDYIWVWVWVIIFNSEQKVLIAQRWPKASNERWKWEFPWWSVEFGEKFWDSVAREINEELGINIEIIELLDIVEHLISDEKQHRISLTYTAKLISWTPSIQEPEKCTWVKWIKIKDINPEELSIVSQSNYNKYMEKYWKYIF